jgi:hypothetical protein
MLCCAEVLRGMAMNITIRNNRILVTNAELGEHFPKVIGDLVIDLKGRVKVQTATPFFTDLARIDPRILIGISEVLDVTSETRIAVKLKKKIDKIANEKIGNEELAG